ncbi:MAG: patatin-like phospholipase family protein [Bacteroidales bacterium]|nr:patatin-like phospholipase family protein [Bacteroidales bacterium]
MKSSSARLVAVLLLVFSFTISSNAAERLDSLLANCTTRPKVGLVLSGGGAKGSAHIGVLKVLEDLGIHVDYVTGTSMGSIMGGMYALGYKANELDTIIRGMDWSIYMSNTVKRSELSTQRKRSDMRYLLDVPFVTGLGLLDNLDRRRDGNAPGVPDFTTSLPAGVINGQNVLNLLTGLSVGYQDYIDFNDLPIPFACVAVDLITNEEVVFHSGHLPTAIRASMAIPGVFSPVQLDNMTLIDGGFRNNFPTDVCKEMGADIIIGVDVSDKGEHDAENTRSLPQIMQQFLNISTNEAHIEHSEMCDVLIIPDISGYGSLSFDSASIDTLIERGHKAALAHVPELLKIKEALDKYDADTSRDTIPRAVNMYRQSFDISSIIINGVSERDTKWLLLKTKLRGKDSVTGNDIEKALSVFSGTGVYNNISYRFEPDGEKYILFFDLNKRPPHELGFGLRYDSDEAANILAEIGINAHRINAFRLNLNSRLGFYPKFEAQLLYVPYYFPSVGISYSYKTLGLDYTVPNANHFPSFVGYKRLQSEFFIKETYSKYFTAHLGLRYSRYRMYQSTYENMAAIVEEPQNHVIETIGNLDYDVLDNAYYPTRGIKTNFTLKYMLAQDFYEADQENPLNPLIFYWDFLGAIPLGERFAFETSFYIRGILNDDNQLFYTPVGNALGGDFPGRYYEAQAPFVGLIDAHLGYSYLGVGRIDARVKLSPKLYAYAMYNYGISTSDLKNIQSPLVTYDLHGAGLKLSYDSIIGPLSIQGHWSSQWNRFGVYVNAGYIF